MYNTHCSVLSLWLFSTLHTLPYSPLCFWYSELSDASTLLVPAPFGSRALLVPAPFWFPHLLVPAPFGSHAFWFLRLLVPVPFGSCAFWFPHLLVPAPFGSRAFSILGPLHGKIFPFLSDRNPTWTHSSITSKKKSKKNPQIYSQVFRSVLLSLSVSILCLLPG